MNIVRLMLLSRQMKNRRHEKNNMVTGIPPLTFTAKKTGTLKNYRIYGNTVNGESVGDRTDNIIRDYIVIKTQAQYAVALLIDAELIPNTTYSFICLLNDSGLRLYVNENLFNTVSYVKDDVVLKVIVKTLSELPDSQKVDGKWIMLKNSITEPVVPELSNIMMIKGSETPAIYEPYGYRVPVTINSNTTNIYLPEQLTKTNDNTDYIDYATQKRHNSDGTESSITLPEIAVTAGTNTFTIGTEVQPSRVELTGKIKEAQTNGSGNT